MENQINIERLARGGRRRRVQLRGCPHCGGDVRLVRDVYGPYHQCLQCSREINPAALVPITHVAVEHSVSIPDQELLTA